MQVRKMEMRDTSLQPQRDQLNFQQQQQQPNYAHLMTRSGSASNSCMSLRLIPVLFPSVSFFSRGISQIILLIQIEELLPCQPGEEWLGVAVVVVLLLLPLEGPLHLKGVRLELRVGVLLHPCVLPCLHRCPPNPAAALHLPPLPPGGIHKQRNYLTFRLFLLPFFLSLQHQPQEFLWRFFVCCGCCPWRCKKREKCRPSSRTQWVGEGFEISSPFQTTQVQLQEGRETIRISVFWRFRWLRRIAF